MEKQKIFIYGSKSYALLLEKILFFDLGIETNGYIDDFAHGSIINNKNVVSFNEFLKLHDSTTKILIGIGYNNLEKRHELISKIKKSNINLYTLIHPNSYISKSSLIGEGCVIMNNSSVDHGSTIGTGCVVWPGAIISHDCSIGDNCFISPSATICGFSKIGDNVFIGANSTIVNNISVANNSFIKAGSIIKQ